MGFHQLGWLFSLLWFSVSVSKWTQTSFVRQCVPTQLHRQTDVKFNCQFELSETHHDPTEFTTSHIHAFDSYLKCSHTTKHFVGRDWWVFLIKSSKINVCLSVPAVLAFAVSPYFSYFFLENFVCTSYATRSLLVWFEKKVHELGLCACVY